MRILKNYEEYRLYESSDMEELIRLNFQLVEIEIELQKEIDDLEPFGATTTHTDLQDTYPVFRAINDLGDAIHRCTKLKNYLDFVKYGYE